MLVNSVPEPNFLRTVVPSTVCLLAPGGLAPPVSAPAAGVGCRDRGAGWWWGLRELNHTCGWTQAHAFLPALLS